MNYRPNRKANARAHPEMSTIVYTVESEFCHSNVPNDSLRSLTRVTSIPPAPFLPSIFCQEKESDNSDGRTLAFGKWAN